MRIQNEDLKGVILASQAPGFDKLVHSIEVAEAKALDHLKNCQTETLPEARAEWKTLNNLRIAILNAPELAEKVAQNQSLANTINPDREH